MDVIYRSRRALVAAITGGAATIAVLLQGGIIENDADARRVSHGPDIEGPCGHRPQVNKCKHAKDCCTDYCRRGRCRYKKAGETCTSRKQCRGGQTCLANICTPGSAPTSTPAPTSTSVPTSTPTATATPIAGWQYQSDITGLTGTNAAAITGDGITSIVGVNADPRIRLYTRPTLSPTAAWTLSTSFGAYGNGTSDIQVPSQIFVSSNTLSLYIADVAANRISWWSRSTTSSTDWAHVANIGSSGSGVGQFLSPAAVHGSPDGLALYVSDTGNGRISVWTRPDGSSTSWSNVTTFGTDGGGPSDFSYPAQVALSLDELSLYITDANNNRVSIWTRPSTAGQSWTNATTFGTYGSGSGQFSTPMGIVRSSDDLTLYVSDRTNSRICIWTRPNTSSTSWSQTGTLGSQGTGAGQLYWPRQVAITADNITLQVADTQNSRTVFWRNY